MKARHLSKQYVRGRWPQRTQAPVIALSDVTLDLASQSALALVGRSGAGKSTLARCLCRAEIPDSGSVHFDGEDFFSLRGAAFIDARRRMQLIFQQSATALSPRLTALESIAEPLRVQARWSRKEQLERARDVMEQVALPQNFSERLPIELSGGQRQRVALARAVICQPKLLILDEGLAGLDSLTQARMVDLLLKLQTELALSYIFITHDLGLAARVAAEVAVMHEGRIVETGSAADWSTFTHPESLRLICAVVSDWRLQRLAAGQP